VARVGVCEDDPAVRRVLREGLRSEGHDVVLAHDGGEALRLFAGDADLAVLVLDIGLPDADGRDLCLALRARGCTAPALFLTAYGSPDDVASGFHAGGDDYVVKPFELREVLLRVAVLARRHQPVTGGTGLRLDPARHALVTEDREVLLSPTEFRLLASLAARPGEVVRRHELVAATWPGGGRVSENTLDSFVRRVRARLVEAGSAARVETVRGVGLVLR
jgi:two-component system, OmpR family, response regulator